MDKQDLIEMLMKDDAVQEAVVKAVILCKHRAYSKRVNELVKKDVVESVKRISEQELSSLVKQIASKFGYDRFWFAREAIELGIDSPYISQSFGERNKTVRFGGILGEMYRAGLVERRFAGGDLKKWRLIETNTQPSND